jgi:hypothetical protein
VQTRVAKLAFNRGLVSRLGLARADIKRLQLAAEDADELGLARARLDVAAHGLGLPRQLEERCGGAPHPVRLLDIRQGLIELTDSKMRVWISDALVTRVAVATAVTNGTFNANIAGWTDNATRAGRSRCSRRLHGAHGQRHGAGDRGPAGHRRGRATGTSSTPCRS